MHVTERIMTMAQELLSRVSKISCLLIKDNNGNTKLSIPA